MCCVDMRRRRVGFQVSDRNVVMGGSLVLRVVMGSGGRVLSLLGVCA